MVSSVPLLHLALAAEGGREGESGEGRKENGSAKGSICVGGSANGR